MSELKIYYEDPSYQVIKKMFPAEVLGRSYPKLGESTSLGSLGYWLLITISVVSCAKLLLFEAGVKYSGKHNILSSLHHNSVFQVYNFSEYRMQATYSEGTG